VRIDHDRRSEDPGHHRLVFPTIGRVSCKALGQLLKGAGIIDLAFFSKDTVCRCIDLHDESWSTEQPAKAAKASPLDPEDSLPSWASST